MEEWTKWKICFLLKKLNKQKIHLERVLQRRYPFGRCDCHNVTFLFQLWCCDGTALQNLFDCINIVGGFLRRQMNIAEVTFTNQRFDTKIVDVYTQIIRFFDNRIIYG